MTAITPAKVMFVTWLGPFVYLLYGMIASDNAAAGASIVTLGVCVVGLMTFFIGCLFANAVRLAAQARPVLRSSKKMQVVAVALSAMAALGASLMFVAWSSLGLDVTSFDQDLLYDLNVRYAEEGRFLVGGAGRLYALLPVVVLLMLYLLRHGFISQRVALVVALLALALMISPRRAMLFVTLISALFVLTQARRLHPMVLLTIAVIGISVFAAIFAITQGLVRKIDVMSVPGIATQLWHYYASPMLVMDVLLGSDHFADEWILLNVPVRIVNFAFASNLPVDLAVPFVTVPEPANTVPMFYYFYKSGGLVAVSLCSYSVGLLSTLALRMYKRTSGFFYGASAALGMTGILLSVRECLFITYDWWYWMLTLAVIQALLLRSRPVS